MVLRSPISTDSGELNSLLQELDVDASQSPPRLGGSSVAQEHSAGASNERSLLTEAGKSVKKIKNGRFINSNLFNSNSQQGVGKEANENGEMMGAEKMELSEDSDTEEEQFSPKVMFAPDQYKIIREADKTDRKYSLKMFPVATAKFMSICRHRIGKSNTMCIETDCSTNHKGGVVDNIAPGSWVVMKDSNKTAFCSPVVPKEHISEDLATNLSSYKESLDDWVHIFDLVKGIHGSTKCPVTNAELIEEAQEENRAIDHKTPKKRSATRVELSFYKKQKLPDNVTSMDDNTKVRLLLDFMGKLDLGLEGLCAAMETMQKEVELLSEDQHEGSMIMEKKVGAINRIVGKKSKKLVSAIEAPSLWDAIEVLNNKVNTLGIERLVTTSPSHASLGPSSLSPTLDEGVFIKIIRTLNSKISNMAARVANVESLSIPGGGADVGGAATITKMEESLAKLDSRVADIEQGSDDNTVTYGGVTWESPDDAELWINSEMSVSAAGLIVDPHIVMEHVMANVAGGKFLDIFLKTHKLHIHNLAQGYAMSSYEQPVPKFFSSGSLKVIMGDTSHLDKIPTWDEWDYPTTGLRDVLKKELETFQSGHTKMINNTLSRGSAGHTLSTLSMTESVGVLKGLITFFDDFMKQLTKAKFSKSKALHVTSRLICRIFEEIFVSRVGVMKYFRAGDMSQITASIVFTSMQSLSSALKMQTIGFADLDIVASELVKFMLTNTSYDSIDSMTVKLAELEKLSSELKSSVKGAGTAATTLSNNLDNLKKQYTGLEKRVKKLE